MEIQVTEDPVTGVWRFQLDGCQIEVEPRLGFVKVDGQVHRVTVVEGEDERILRVDLVPHWKTRKAKSIGRQEVSEVLDGIVARGAPIMANRTKALISKIYNFSIGRGMVEHNPCLGVPLPAKARQRDRVLSENEIRSLWRVLDQEEPVMAATFKMRLLTAQRGVEVLTMRWEHLDGDWWTIPAEVAKNGLTHRVALASQAQYILDELRPVTGYSEWVFASSRREQAHITAVQKAAERIAKRAEVDFVPHDLRRTAASFMTSMGISRLVVSKILNHVESGITAVYDRHSYDAEKWDALTRWAGRLEEMLAGAGAMAAIRHPSDPVSLSQADTEDVRTIP